MEHHNGVQGIRGSVDLVVAQWLVLHVNQAAVMSLGTLVSDYCTVKCRGGGELAAVATPIATLEDEIWYSEAT